jgi:DNA-binding transcriptional regulator/RsmH inhibitor MraZ
MDFFQRKLDDKNRLTIPADMRAEFKDGKAVLTPGFGNYLHLYPESVWNTEMERALSGAGWQPSEKPVILNEELADINARLRFGKVNCSLDAKQGRITIEPHLMELAGIEREVAAIRIPTETGSYWRLRKP